ncbi:MAG: ribosome biogenesis GTPase YlqF [Pseudohongiella sp.]|nr:ribosome biogenesis GTPase YlqF [Pseudohongiella sp.]
MTISWYPGHMFKANKELAKLMQQIDIVIEVLDARMPYASSNPLMHKMRLRHHKPCLHILNKADLADPDSTRAWLKYLNSQPGSRAIANGKESLISTDLIVGACQRLVNEQALMPKKPEVELGTEELMGTEEQAPPSPLTPPSPIPAEERYRQRKYNAVIAGIPNVGKSTLMNQIIGRKLAKTGNEPAVTKSQQRVKLNEQWYLFDTPGVLWPRLEDQQAAYRLAAAGAIRNTAIVFEDVAMVAAEFLLKDFPQALKTRYKLTELPETAEDFMIALATKRACRSKSGSVDWHRVSEILLHDFREGRLGCLTLEQPPTS